MEATRALAPTGASDSHNVPWPNFLASAIAFRNNCIVTRQSAAVRFPTVELSAGLSIINTVLVVTRRILSIVAQRRFVRYRAKAILHEIARRRIRMHGVRGLETRITKR